jgi:hypothetical protein
LQGCWTVQVAENQPGMKNFVQRVKPAIAELEYAGETHFQQQRAMAHLREKGALSHVYLPLLKAGVERAGHLAHPYRPEEDPDHVHLMHIVTTSGGSVSGSDEALDLLMDALNEKSDNPAKLRASGAEQCHLFVWLDGDTWFNIARPLRHLPGRTTDGVSPRSSRRWILPLHTCGSCTLGPYGAGCGTAKGGRSCET